MELLLSRCSKQPQVAAYCLTPPSYGPVRGPRAPLATGQAPFVANLRQLRFSCAALRNCSQGASQLARETKSTRPTSDWTCCLWVDLRDPEIYTLGMVGKQPPAQLRERTSHHLASQRQPPSTTIESTLGARPLKIAGLALLAIDRPGLVWGACAPVRSVRV